MNLNTAEIPSREKRLDRMIEAISETKKAYQDGPISKYKLEESEVVIRPQYG